MAARRILQSLQALGRKVRIGRVGLLDSAKQGGGEISVVTKQTPYHNRPCRIQ
ncbi:hypothetical protein Ancab_022173, partial [Ancistrocladus abbreviatus]